jgi:hypothetical protein
MANAIEVGASKDPDGYSAVEAEASRVPRCLPLASVIQVEASRVPRCLPLASAV